MKLVKEHLNENIKHLSGKSKEEVFEEFFADGRILFNEFTPFIEKIENQLGEAGVKLFELKPTSGPNDEVVFDEELKKKFVEKLKENFDNAIDYWYDEGPRI